MVPLARRIDATRSSAAKPRAALRASLETRRREIEQAVLTRIYAIADPSEAADPAYLEGLRAALTAALDYGLAGVERGEEREPPIPTALLAQARLAARNGVSLETVLRRYFAGYTLLGDFLVEEAGECGLGAGELKRLLRAQAGLFDRLLAMVSEEYTREGKSRPEGSEQRRAETVQRLLDGELLGATELGYELGGHHIGLVASGPGAAEATRDLAAGFDCRLLVVCLDGGTVWAWFGTRREPDSAELKLFAAESRPAEVFLAFGEPGEGLAGWRLSHRQAAAALPIALRDPGGLIHYGEVSLLAAALQDDLLATSLRKLYLDPLEGAGADAGVARDTLRAYFAADHNVSSAAAALGVNRHTVASRLRAIEYSIGSPLSSVACELNLALRVADLGAPDPPPRP